MHKHKKILGIIPARSSSKRIPRKNIALLNGKPLISYTIQSALGSAYLDRVIVSTDDKEIAEVAEKYGAEVPFLRPEHLSGDDIGPDFVVYQHAIKALAEKEKYIPDIIVELQPTSPLRSAVDIDAVIKKLLTTKADAVVTVSETKNHPFLMRTLSGDRVQKYVAYDDTRYARRQDYPKIYELNGAVLAVTYEQLMDRNNDIGDDTRAIVMPIERSIDIDEPMDLALAELLLKKYEESHQD